MIAPHEPIEVLVETPLGTFEAQAYVSKSQATDPPIVFEAKLVMGTKRLRSPEGPVRLTAVDPIVMAAPPDSQAEKIHHKIAEGVPLPVRLTHAQHCPDCGEAHPSSYCPHCGHLLRIVRPPTRATCPECQGGTSDADTRGRENPYCGRCGRRHPDATKPEAMRMRAIGDTRPR